MNALPIVNTSLTNASIVHLHAAFVPTLLGRGALPGTILLTLTAPLAAIPSFGVPTAPPPSMIDRRTGTGPLPFVTGAERGLNTLRNASSRSLLTILLACDALKMPC